MGRLVGKRFCASRGGQLRNGRLFADDELHFGNEANDELAIWSNCLRQRTTPLFHLHLVLYEDLADQSLDGLRQRGIGCVALVLAELACREKPARRNQRLVQLVHH
jgi:hypothetical protein